jgi:hypothetical protein
MGQESSGANSVEQAISRALRENLERIQRTSDELHQAVGDVVAACASSKPTNALPSMLRAQAAAASLSAVLEVLSRFVTVSLHPGPRSSFDAQLQSEVARIASTAISGGPTVALRASAAPVAEHEVEATQELRLDPPHVVERAEAEIPPPAGEEAGYESDFNVSRLSTEEQELHRRANRVAKVSMQDIKMLHPEQVQLGRQNKDICIRLKEDIEKAHREYDRRFKPIMDHPVDYFYRWMVEILAEGDAHALGEYPYATPARQR